MSKSIQDKDIKQFITLDNSRLRPNINITEAFTLTGKMNVMTEFIIRYYFYDYIYYLYLWGGRTFHTLLEMFFVEHYGKTPNQVRNVISIMEEYGLISQQQIFNNNLISLSSPSLQYLDLKGLLKHREDRAEKSKKGVAVKQALAEQQGKTSKNTKKKEALYRLDKMSDSKLIHGFFRNLIYIYYNPVEFISDLKFNPNSDFKFSNTFTNGEVLNKLEDLDFYPFGYENNRLRIALFDIGKWLNPEAVIKKIKAIQPYIDKDFKVHIFCRSQERKDVVVSYSDNIYKKYREGKIYIDHFKGVQALKDFDYLFIDNLTLANARKDKKPVKTARQQIKSPVSIKPIFEQRADIKDNPAIITTVQETAQPNKFVVETIVEDDFSTAKAESKPKAFEDNRDDILKAYINQKTKQSFNREKIIEQCMDFHNLTQETAEFIADFMEENGILDIEKAMSENEHMIR